MVLLLHLRLQPILSATHNCIDHYAIDFPVTPAVTCEALQVDIESHYDQTDHTRLVRPEDGTTITVTANVAVSVDVTWLEGAGGNGSLVAGPGLNQAQYTFDGTETSVPLFLSYPNAEFGVDVDDGTVTDSEATEDPTVEFVLAVFRFLDTLDNDIGTQIAAKPSDVAPGEQTLQLRSVQTNTTTLECEAALTGLAIPIELAYQCDKPSICQITNGVDIDIAGTPTTIMDVNSGVPPNYTTVNMDFSPAGIAEFSFDYDDAGELSLLARKVIAADPSATPPTTAVTILSTSALFVVRPFGFDVQVTGNPGATGPRGAGFVSAGTAFTATFRAVVWESGDDDGAPSGTPNDGIPDGHETGDTDPTNNADLTNNAATLNFGQEGVDESTDEDTVLTALLDQPGGGNDPGLTGGTTITTISLGSGSTASAQYDEVGIIEITGLVADGDYLGIGGVSANIRGKTSYVGRFGADNFTFTANTPELGPACGIFTYVDQPFDFVTAPQITARATATDGTTILSNYEDFTGSGGDNWWLLDFSTGVNMNYTDLAVPTDISLDSVLADYSPNSGSTGTNGQQQFDLTGPFAYTKDPSPTSLQPPFNGDLRLDLTVTDSDGATGTHTINPINFTNPEQRWGRLAIQNAAGSELLDLTTPLSTEYWNGTSFIINTDDSCTVIETLATGISLSNPDTGGGVPQPGNTAMVITDGTTSITPAVGPSISSGIGSMVFSARMMVMPRLISVMSILKWSWM